jgi:gamma-glutamyl hydrolase
VRRRPGILDQDGYNGTYIAASYVKYIEGAGGRVVAIPYRASHEVLQQLFSQINGLLLPGGGMEFAGKFLDSAQVCV